MYIFIAIHFRLIESMALRITCGVNSVQLANTSEEVEVLVAIVAAACDAFSSLNLNL
ncbi:hypothetical protein ACQKDB_12295 [Planococcus kocurii]|uniref:hypothetical protein n=1 Tax=Planococcus kocurii TaxID=1374 RepID=UPI003CFC110B